MPLFLDPQRGGLLEFFNELRLGNGSSQTHGQVNMVFDTTDTVSFALAIATNRGEVSLEAMPDFQIYEGTPIFRTEHKVQDYLAEGLWHVGRVKWFSRTRAGSAKSRNECQVTELHSHTHDTHHDEGVPHTSPGRNPGEEDVRNRLALKAPHRSSKLG